MTSYESKTNPQQKELETADIARIMKLLPHRYPFLLVDRVLELKPGESIRALKNVTFSLSRPSL